MRHLFLASALLAGSVVGGGLDAATHDWQSYVQVRYTSSDDRGDYLSLRRLKLFGQGPLSGDWTYFLQFLYKDGNRSLTDDRIVMQEANVSHPVKSGKLTSGQFRPPFGMERFTSDYLLPLIDRSQPAVSFHMAKLKQAGLLSARKEGQWVHYSLRIDALREGPLALLAEIVSLAEASAQTAGGACCCD